MLIYSMSVSADGFIADREGAFGWTVPSDELFGTEWARATAPTEEELELLRRYVDAHERADADALAELLCDERA